MLSSTMQREPMSSVDRAWLHMDDPTNLMMINGVLLFDETVDFARLRATVAERLLTLRRFRQRIMEPLIALGTPMWQDDPHFHLDAHVHRLALPAPGDMAELRQTGDRLALGDLFVEVGHQLKSGGSLASLLDELLTREQG